VTYGHAIVWLDHREAVCIEFSANDHRTTNVHADEQEGKLHLKSGKPGSGHAPDDVRFFTAIVRAVTAPEVLVVGPGTAKTAFVRSVADDHPAFANRVVGVQTVDHPSPGQLLALGREFFQRFDQLHSDRHSTPSIVK
jgi:hypothetical protein